jgi:uncharacterized protein (DUF488 family)
MGEICTIGYEGAAVEDFFATLRLAKIDLVLDIRELPVSRRRGFSKGALAAALEAEGIGYEHLKGLGNPKEGRDAAKLGRFEEFVAIFAAHMQTEAAHADLEKALGLVSGKQACLLCYERDFRACHRNIVSERISGITGQPVRNLGVRNGTARELARKEIQLAAYA